MGADFIKVSSNIPELKDIFKKLGGAPEVLDSFAAASAFEAEQIAKFRAPKDEGTLAGSINNEPNREVADFGVYALKANVDYAPYLEFGTGGKVDVPKELSDFALQFKGTAKIAGQKAQPYLYRSALDGQKMFKDFLFKWIEKTKKGK